MKKGKKYSKLNLQVIDWGQPIMGSTFTEKWLSFFAANIPFLPEILIEKQKRKKKTLYFLKSFLLYVSMNKLSFGPKKSFSILWP